MTFKKIIIISLLSISLTACMGVKFTYNNLDWVIPWYLDDYLSLNDQQDDSFDSLSKKQQQKFRKRLLRYADDFSELAEQEIN